MVLFISIVQVYVHHFTGEFQFACSFCALKRNLEMCDMLVKLSDPFKDILWKRNWIKFSVMKFQSYKLSGPGKSSEIFDLTSQHVCQLETIS